MPENEEDVRPPAPGETVRIAMEAAGWIQSDLAYVLGVTTGSVTQILSGKRGISPAMAKALGQALKLAPEVLAKLQAEWDLHQAQEPDPIIGARAHILASYPVREMIKRGWIIDTDAPNSLVRQICRFFDVSTLDDVPHLAHAAKRTGYDSIPGAQLAWLFRVRAIASEMRVAPYSQEKLQRTIDALSSLTSRVKSIGQVPRLLSEAGVRFVVVEGLPGSKIDGVCLWLNDNSPVVGLSLRFDRIDNFWFVLRHELAHVLHCHGLNAAILDTNLEDPQPADINDEEQIANQEGTEFCVPQKAMHSFYLRKNPLFSERDVLAFAKRINVHPGLVVGQLQQMTKRYNLLRDHLIKVRDHLSASMMMDGWGDLMPVGG